MIVPPWESFLDTCPVWEVLGYLLAFVDELCTSQKLMFTILLLSKLKSLAHEFSLIPSAQGLAFTFMLSQSSYFLLFFKRADTLCWQGCIHIYCCIEIYHITSLLTLSIKINKLFVKFTKSNIFLCVSIFTSWLRIYSLKTSIMIPL